MSTRRDDGFTVFEVAITMAIVGIIGSVLVGVMVIGFRTTDKTSDRLADSTDAQLVSTYFVGDVQSAGASVFTDGTGPPCGTGTVNVLTMSWVDLGEGPTPAGQTYVAAYWVIATADGRELSRIVCQPPGTIISERVIAKSLHPTVDPLPTITGARVSLEITTDKGDVYTVAGERRSLNYVAAPSGTGPPGPTTTSSSTSTTSTTTTTLACSAAITTIVPNPVQLNVQSGNLKNDVVVTLSASASCPALKLQYTPASDPLTVTCSKNGGSQTCTINKTQGAWTTGPKTLTVHENGTVRATGTLQVNP